MQQQLSFKHINIYYTIFLHQWSVLLSRCVSMILNTCTNMTLDHMNMRGGDGQMMISQGQAPFHTRGCCFMMREAKYGVSRFQKYLFLKILIGHSRNKRMCQVDISLIILTHKSKLMVKIHHSRRHLHRESSRTDKMRTTGGHNCNERCST